MKNEELLNFNHLFFMLRDFPMEEYGFFLWRFAVFTLSLHRKQEVKLLNIIDMKRFHTLMTMVAIAMLSFTVTSCETDEDIADTLWGTWEGNMYVTSYWNNRYYDASYSEITFDRDPSTYSSGRGYWVDYYSNAPWDYIANHIRWNVRGGNIRVYFVEDDYEAEIYDYRLSYNYFDGYIYTYDDKEVEFHLTKTDSPDWGRYNYGWDYWRGRYAKQNVFEGTRASFTDVEKPQRMFRVRE